MSTHSKPIELVRCKQQIDAAWKMYDAAIDAGNNADELYNVAVAFLSTYSSLYARWQKLGGTSDIESIEQAEIERGSKMENGPHYTLAEFSAAKDRNFNRRYYGKP